MSDLRIRRLLESRLLTWAESQEIKVATENTPFTPPNEEIYLECFLLPGATNDEFLAGGHTAYVGVFQINIRAPLNQGPGPSGEVAEQLRALFPNLLALTDSSGFTVTVMSPLSIAQGFVSRERWLVPTSFVYRADTVEN